MVLAMALLPATRNKADIQNDFCGKNAPMPCRRRQGDGRRKPLSGANDPIRRCLAEIPA
jgi:hypothetical protein